MSQLLQKKQIIDTVYEIQFFISGNDYFQKYRAKGKDGKIYLLKLYNSSKLSSYQFTEDELLETEVLKKIKHKNIIRFENSGEIVLNKQKYHYLIMDFVSGETLKDKLKRDGIFSPYVITNFIEELLTSLEYLHNLSGTIIHNNINIDTVWIDYSENYEKPVLSDFNSARYVSNSSKSINLKQLNPFYTAPELLNGIFTPQSDIFSVGALMYHLIFGSPPWYIEISDFQFSEKKFKTLLSDKREQSLTFGIPGLKELDDEHIINTLKKALAINVDDRFKTVNEFIKALKRKTVLSTSDTEKNTITKKKHISQKKGKGFSQIAGMQDLKDILYNDVIRALDEKELYESYGVTIPNGMLLYGPPGCGKTFISEKFSEEVSYNFYQLKPSDIKSRFVNATEENIGKIFKEAEKNAPSIIFIDEVDAVMPNREGELHQMHASAVNEFLTQMSNCSEKGIFVIAASNRPEKIDPAILRTGRIDRIIYLPPPDKEARELLFKLYLKKRPVDLGVNYEMIAELTEFYVSSDIKFLVDEASRKALKTQERITQQLLENVIKNSKPSVSKVEIQKYEFLRQKFEDINQVSIQKQRNKLGF